MTEVEQAWHHLRACQIGLARARYHLGQHQSAKWPSTNYYWLTERETDVLAALSWVWDAQERAGLRGEGGHDD
jgi:hypothetical protein